MIKLITLLLTILTLNIYAQMGNWLMVGPRHLHFNSDFERSQIVQVKNYSSGTVNIDSVVYDDSIYLIRMSINKSFPIVLESDSSFEMEILQYNYFNLTSSDSTSSITIYNSSSESEIVLRTHHHQEFHDMHEGSIDGLVSSNGVSIEGATIYFFYNQNLLVDSVKTDGNGYYEKRLPEGNYFVAAKTNGYYMSFAYGNDSPLGADLININRMIPNNVNFELEEELATDISISGEVTDTQYDVLGKAIVIVRKGKHTPTRSLDKIATDSVRYYTTITDFNGHYDINNIKSEGDYYVQAFSPFNIPGYFNHDNSPSVFWQKADSINVSTSIEDIDITLQRDSSYGAGVVEGTIITNEPNSSFSDAIIFVRSKENNKVYSYNFTSSSGKFSIPVLPYGEYDLVSNTFGLDDVLSSTFTISTNQDTVKGIELNLNLTSLEFDNVTSQFQLSQNYPNPFNPSTIIKFTLAKKADVKLIIYNILGEKIRVLLNGHINEGNYNVVFDASYLSSGIYFYELQSGLNRIVKKMSLLK